MKIMLINFQFGITFFWMTKMFDQFIMIWEDLFVLFVCLGFHVISTVFQLFNSDSSQIHVSWTIFNQYLTSPLSLHWWTSCSANPIIQSAKEESHYYQF